MSEKKNARNQFELNKMAESFLLKFRVSHELEPAIVLGYDVHYRQSTHTIAE